MTKFTLFYSKYNNLSIALESKTCTLVSALKHLENEYTNNEDKKDILETIQDLLVKLSNKDITTEELIEVTGSIHIDLMMEIGQFVVAIGEPLMELVNNYENPYTVVTGKHLEMLKMMYPIMLINTGELKVPDLTLVYDSEESRQWFVDQTEKFKKFDMTNEEFEQILRDVGGQAALEQLHHYDALEA